MPLVRDAIKEPAAKTAGATKAFADYGKDGRSTNLTAGGQAGFFKYDCLYVPKRAERAVAPGC